MYVWHLKLKWKNFYYIFLTLCFNTVLGYLFVVAMVMVTMVTKTIATMVTMTIAKKVSKYSIKTQG